MCLGSMLGTLLIFYIKDLDENVPDVVSKFEDYTKIDDRIDSDEDYQELRWDLDQQTCEVLHFLGR